MAKFLYILERYVGNAETSPKSQRLASGGPLIPTSQGAALLEIISTEDIDLPRDPIKFDFIDGSIPACEVRFNFNGREYVLDLSEENRQELECILSKFEYAIERYISHSCPVDSRDALKAEGEIDHELARQWALDNGCRVSRRALFQKIL